MLKESLLFVCSGKNPVEMECIYDNGIFKGNEKFSHGLLSVFCSNDETLRKIDSGVVLTLDIESLQLIVDILDKIIHKKKYNPEICEILVPKRKKLMTTTIPSMRAILKMRVIQSVTMRSEC